MKIAMPVAGGKLCMHFGHCEEFIFVEIDEKEKKILDRKSVTSPPHAPGMLPSWVKDHGANVVIAGGMGMRAQQIFKQHGIEIITGARETDPEKLALDYANGTLETGENVCDH